MNKSKNSKFVVLPRWIDQNIFSKIFSHVLTERIFVMPTGE
jgi:hypothetical protein